MKKFFGTNSAIKLSDKLRLSRFLKKIIEKFLIKDIGKKEV